MISIVTRVRRNALCTRLYLGTGIGMPSATGAQSVSSLCTERVAEILSSSLL